MAKIHPHYFSAQELRLGCKRCIENVKGLLAGAKILNGNQMTQQYALGLYMYAVEEYGKAILLKNAIKGNKKRYQIDGWILGFGNPDPDPISGNKMYAHNEKIRVALDTLPSDCRRILRGVKVTKAFPSTKTIIVKKGNHGSDNLVSVLAQTTGTYYDTTHTNPFDYNLDLKTACFYMDWDQINNCWKYDVVTMPEDLKKNIKCLEDALINDILSK